MRRPIFALALFVALSLPTFAQVPDVSLEDARAIGVDIGLRWDSFKLIVGGGYELLDLGRDLATGEPRPASDPKTGIAVPDFRLSGRQIWTVDKVDLWAGSGVVGQGNFGFGPAASGAFPDRTGGLLGFVQIGAKRDQQTTNEHGVRSGLSWEASAEWGPSQASLRQTDYRKVSVETGWLLPLWDWESPQQLFSGVVGLRAAAQWLDGNTVPVQLFLPTDVRGYHEFFDTTLRASTTAELRVSGPSLWGPSDVVPLLLAFTDAGWYSGYTNAPSAVSRRQGALLSVGTGVGLSLFGAMTPVVSVALPLRGEKDLWWTVETGLRF